MTWRALLIDDEEPARNRLRELLAERSDVEVVGEAASVAEAEQLCGSLRPDLLFLDLQMPRGSGFELLGRINPVPDVIFVTAHDQYAVRAFEVNAIDYLLKPVFAERLDLAMCRLAGRRSEAAEAPRARFRDGDRLFLPTSNGLRVALIRQVTHVTADGNYTSVKLFDGSSHLIDRSMNEWEALLPAAQFVRLDRSLLLNLAHIESLRVNSRDTAQVTVSGSSEVLKIGRAGRSRLQSALKNRDPGALASWHARFTD